jgi:hypothetical protein
VDGLGAGDVRLRGQSDLEEGEEGRLSVVPHAHFR